VNRCVPKKLTWHAADIAETIKHAKRYGFTVEETAPFNWNYFKQKRDAYVKKLNGIYERNLDSDGAQFAHGKATFTGKKQIELTLDDGSKYTVKGKHVLIATGGYPSIPTGIPGSELGTNSDGFFELEQQPKTVAIVGAGYIAVEFAGLFNALGTETHLFIRHDNFLRPFDPVISESIAKEYERQGIHIHRQSSQSKVEDLGDGKKKLYYKDSNGEGTLEIESLIWAIGRDAETKDLNLEAAGGVKQNEKGHIIVDEYQNTNIEGVYSVGDVCDRGFELTPVAIAAGRRLVDRIFGGQKDRKLDYSNIPSVVFAHPEAGSIGLTEPEAREKYGDAVKVYNSTFISLWNSMFEDGEKTRSSYKLIVQGKDEKVVGLHIVGEGSSEILQGFGVAIKMGATKTDFDSVVAIHPTSAEEIVTLK
jgi:glutathione reductase (NADPH)